MASIFSLPWSNPPKKSELLLGGGTSHTDALLASWRNAGSGDDDAELAALLARLAASGRPLTEDAIVDCQLAQFPAYGTNHTAGGGTAAASANNSIADADGGDDDDYDGYDCDDAERQPDETGTTRHPIRIVPRHPHHRKHQQHHLPAPTLPPPPHHWLTSPWGAMLGGGGKQHGSGKTPLPRDASLGDDHPSTAAAKSSPAGAAPAATTANRDNGDTNHNTHNNSNSNSDDTEWDLEEQRLWKRVPAAAVAASSSTMDPTQRKRRAVAAPPAAQPPSHQPRRLLYYRQQPPERHGAAAKTVILAAVDDDAPPPPLDLDDGNGAEEGDRDLFGAGNDRNNNNNSNDALPPASFLGSPRTKTLVKTAAATVSLPSGGGNGGILQTQLSSPLAARPKKLPHSSSELQLPPPQQQPQPAVFAAADRQHWMPDQLCKQCYACEIPFTVFRRRHHCRLCGQVFCNACSAHFVPTQHHSYHAAAASSTASAATAANNHGGGGGAGGTSEHTVRVCAMCYAHAASKADALPSPPPHQSLASSGVSKRALTAKKLDRDDDNDGGGEDRATAHDPLRPIYIPPLQALARAQQTHGRSTANARQRILTDDEYDDESNYPVAAAAAARQPEPPPSTEAAPARNNAAAVANDSTATAVRTAIQEGNRHLGQMAAAQLELVARQLLRLHAPLVWNYLPADYAGNNADDHGDAAALAKEARIVSWINALLTLATRCCATVSPNVKKKMGDLLDIRPYVKIKVIPGGSYRDCAYLSGVLFRKTVSHKRMARSVDRPRILLLSGGIEFTRSENRIASLETLFEQEDRYTEILVGKILTLRPDVVLVGRSVSRKAQELLLAAGVILVQHVKATLLHRIARQTGAVVISSTDHVMNQFDVNVLGLCRRFRLVTFRDNEAWTDQAADVDTVALDTAVDATKTTNSRSDAKKNKQGVHAASPPTQRSIKALLADPTLSNHERQAALAANRLGEGVLDGSDAVRAGLAKRGVAHTYIMLEGCPKHLGCTVVLRGANRAALKQLKAVFRFLANTAYNLRLETTYLKERGARLRPDFQLLPQHAYSSSLCVDYGKPPDGRKVRPWNGGNSDRSSMPPMLESGELSAVDHQSILITSVWMTEKTQCCPAEVKGICYYSLQDVAVGQFLRDSCFNLSLKCQNPNCKKSVLDHSLSFVHNDGLINIMVEEMDEALQQPGPPKDNDDDMSDEEEEATDRPIATWTYCHNCRKVVTPLTYISDLTWKFSFGKFLEVFFYNRDAVLNAPGHGCDCNLQSAATLYFGCGKLAARFTYERIAPFGVFVRKSLPLDISFHRREAMRRLDFISVESANLFINFDKKIDKVSREARSLFNSAMNRPEHLQTVLSELNRIGADVDHTAKILQEKIASVSENCRLTIGIDGSLNGALFRFPLFARRYLFNLTTAWNEKLSAAGQAISAMNRIAAISGHLLHDGTMGPNVASTIGDPLYEELSEGMRRLRQIIEHYARHNVTDITQVLPSLQGGYDVPPDVEYDEEFDDPETSLDFADGVDADVLASRRRLKSSKSLDRSRSGSLKPTKTLGTRRSSTDAARPGHDSGAAVASAPPKPTPGGAVKSAITRFFNRGGREYDQYVVDLGIFAEGRPRLAPGVDGIVVPVLDEKLSTIIAYSLASTEYAKQFKHFSKDVGGGSAAEGGGESADRARRPGSTSDVDEGAAGGAVDGERVARLPPADNRSKHQTSPVPPGRAPAGGGTGGSSSTIVDDSKGTERRLLNRNKSHIKHTFRDMDEKGLVTCKFVCTTYWATQFHAVRQSFLSGPSSAGAGSGGTDTAGGNPGGQDVEQSYVESLSSAYSWAASGGKSGASFARTADDRFVIKCISRTELQMFLDCAPAYFEYLCKAFFHGLPTVLCKIVGVYQIGVHNRETGKRSMEQVAVMQNIFYNRTITRIFDLKGSLRGRFAAQKGSAAAVSSSKQQQREVVSDGQRETPPSGGGGRGGGGGNSGDQWPDDAASRHSSTNSLVDDAHSTATESTGRPLPPHHHPRDDGGGSVPDDDPHNSNHNHNHKSGGRVAAGPSTLLDGDFLEFTLGRPMPLTDRAKAVFQMSILNDTLFLSIINVLDYSILVGFDEHTAELVVGIIDFMRQYDILKQMERVGKSLPMVVGSEAPTIIQPPLYKARFTNAMERYFMTVPSKWTAI